MTPSRVRDREATWPLLVVNRATAIQTGQRKSNPGETDHVGSCLAVVAAGTSFAVLLTAELRLESRGQSALDSLSHCEVYGQVRS